MTARRTASIVLTPLVSLAVTLAAAGAVGAGEHSFSGSTAVELRGFYDEPQFAGQFEGIQPSLILSPEYRFQTNDRKNWIIHRGKHCFVVVNVYPYSNGHIMVVCNRQVERLSVLTDEESGEFNKMVARSEQAILEVYKPGGLNIGANVGRSAGAGIEGHLHMHLVRRWHGDTNFMTAIGETRVISEDLLDTYDKLEQYFRQS